jgi:hypothetical protein
MLHNQELFNKTDFYYYNKAINEFRQLTQDELNQYNIGLNRNELMTTDELGLPRPGGRKCFITTACVEAKGLPDDCEELTILRSFRDGYMRFLPNGAAMISEYYDIAPRIVAHIAAQPDANRIFASLYEHIGRSVDLINAGENSEAMHNYITMVSELKKKYL